MSRTIDTVVCSQILESLTCWISTVCYILEINQYFLSGFLFKGTGRP